jgi:hypothetical protein
LPARSQHQAGSQDLPPDTLHEEAEIGVAIGIGIALDPGDQVRHAHEPDLAHAGSGAALGELKSASLQGGIRRQTSCSM